MSPVFGVHYMIAHEQLPTRTMSESLLFLISIIIIFIDQITKFLINTSLQLKQSSALIKNFFHLTYIHNFGAGFGILQQQKWSLVFISIVVIGVIFYYFDRIKEKEILLQVLVGFTLGGTIGNLIDRIVYGFGIDFLDFRIWPIFNFADSFVTIGIIGLIIYLWKKG